MTKEETNLLTLKPYYKIRSATTGRIYMDKDLRCYLFETDREAKQFCEQFDDLEIMEGDYIRQAPFLAHCYGMGIETIRIKEVSKENFTEIKIEKADIRRQYYNPKAVKNIVRLKQTRKKKFLEELMQAEFIVPILIKDRKEKEYPTLQYAYATFQDDTKYYLMFATLQEFEDWNTSQGNIFFPYKTNFKEHKQVRKENPILINPLTDKLILTKEQLD